MHRLVGVLGMLTMMAFAFLFSTNRRAIRGKTVAWGLGLQIVFAYLVINWTYGQWIFQKAGAGVNWVLDFAFFGSQFVFGDLGKKGSPMGFFFAFQVLPTIIFIAAVFALLYYYGVMQFIIKQAARLMTGLMGASGAESLNVAASIFMGQTEAPLTIRPYLPEVTQSELMTIMTSGMAHVSGGMMAAYIAYGVEAKHVLAAVIMTAPGTILLSKMMVPETEVPVTSGKVELAPLERDANALGALARGTVDGLSLALNVGAMLITFIALIYLVDGVFAAVHNGLASSRRHVVSLQRRTNFRLSLLAHRLGHRNSLARLPCHRKLVGLAHGHQRINCLPAPGPHERRARSPLLHHRHLRALRLRKFQLHRNSNRRHRRSRAQ